jgi:hypothetical protein
VAELALAAPAVYRVEVRWKCGLGDSVEAAPLAALAHVCLFAQSWWGIIGRFMDGIEVPTAAFFLHIRKIRINQHAPNIRINTKSKSI